MKRLGWVLAAILVSILATADDSYLAGVATNRDGRPIPNASIRICPDSATGAAGSCTPLANIWSDKAHTLPITQPGFAADIFGNYAAFLVSGWYFIDICTTRGPCTRFTYLAAPATGGGGGGGTPGGIDNDIQYAEGGAFAGSLGLFTYDPSIQTVRLPIITLAQSVTFGATFDATGVADFYPKSTAQADPNSPAIPCHRPSIIIARGSPNGQKLWECDDGDNHWTQAGGQQSLSVPNNGVIGTTLNGLVSIDSTGKGYNTPHGALTGAVGVVTNNAGLAGNATVTQDGQANLTLDNAGVAGDYVQISPTADAQGHDIGLSPCTGQVIGQVLSLVSGSLYSIALTQGMLNPCLAQGGFISATPAANQTIQGTSASVIGLSVEAPTGIPNSTDIFRVLDPSLNSLFSVTKDSGGSYVLKAGTGVNGNTIFAHYDSSTGYPTAPLPSVGILRLTDTDCAPAWRNHANAADITLCKDTSDNLTLLGAAQFKLTGPPAIISGGTLTGASSPGVNITQTWNNGATVFQALVANPTKTAAAAGSTIFSGQAASVELFKMFYAGSFEMGATGFEFEVSKDGQIDRYLNRALGGVGVPYERGSVCCVTQTAQTGSIGTTNLIASAGLGTYRVSYYAYTQIVGVATNTVAVTIAWTDVTGHAKTFVSSTADLTSFTNTGMVQGSVIIHSIASTPITYSTAVVCSGGCTPGVSNYGVDVVMEQIQ